MYYYYHINDTNKLDAQTKIDHIQTKKRYGLVIWYQQLTLVPKYQKK